MRFTSYEHCSCLVVSYVVYEMTHSSTHRHLHLDLAHRLIPHDLEIVRAEPINISDLLLTPLDDQFRELARFSVQLNLKRLHVILVYVRVAHLEDKLVWFRIGNISDHVG